MALVSQLTIAFKDLQTPDICLEVLDEEVESLAAFTGNVSNDQFLGLSFHCL